MLPTLKCHHGYTVKPPSGAWYRIAGSAEACILNGLAVLEETSGSLDRIERVIKLVGYVASAKDFHEQPAVIDAASNLLVEIFGDAGTHARSAVGVAQLPRGAPVEIELVVRLRI